MGEVYRARDTKLGRTVVIKVLPASFTHDPDRLARFEREARALAVVERLGYESGLWDTYIRTDSHIIFNQARKTDGTPASGGPSLSNVDGIFFLGHREVPLDDQQKAELLAFVRIRWSLGLSEAPVQPHAKRDAPSKAER